MGERGRFQLHLPGLLKVLAEHLYSTHRVGLRELLQNAHDSCVRRAMEQAESGYQARINVTCDPQNRTLVVSDNGCGLTEQEINEYLATIGRGYTRGLRERLEFDAPDVSQQLIGQFGIGFLAAFLLAGEVVVETRSVGGGPPLRWRSTGDEYFDLSGGERSQPGTSIELHLKPAAHFLLHEPNLLDIVRTYADFLPTPIFVEDSAAPANLGEPPWETDDPAVACREYVRRRFSGGEPIWLLPLADGKIDLGHDTLTVPLRGFLFVPPESVASVKEYGDVAVYIRRMAICDNERHLLPPWARFIRGVIDSPMLQPTASRESVHQDDAFEAVRRSLAHQLSAGLRNLARHDAATWRKIAYGHSDVIMGWAVKEPEFFELVADLVPVRTTRGRLNMVEYLKLSGNVIYYLRRELGSLQDKVLAEGRNVPVIDASWFAVPAFLQRYAETRRGVVLTPMDDDPASILRPASPGNLQELVRLCEEMGFVTRVAVFAPHDFPAVMTYPPDAETVRDATAALDEGLIPDGFTGFVQGYLAQRCGVDVSQGTLHLNASCPLIQCLAGAEVPAARRQAALGVVAHFARLFCGRMLNAADAAGELRAWQRCLESLVKP